MYNNQKQIIKYKQLLNFPDWPYPSMYILAHGR